MRIALVQQHAGPDKAENVVRGLRAFEAAARAGAQAVGFAELAFEPFADVDFAKNEQSNARRLFMRDRRPESYGAWMGV